MAIENAVDIPSNSLLALLPGYHNKEGDDLALARKSALDTIFENCVTVYIQQIAGARRLEIFYAFHEDGHRNCDGMVIYMRSAIQEKVSASIVLHAETDAIIVGEHSSTEYSPVAAQRLLESQILLVPPVVNTIK